MDDQIFRQYDIRGKVDSEVIIKEIYTLVKAIVFYFVKQNSQVKKIAVGADGRLHSSAIKQELCRALQDSGIDVVFIGICPTPVMYFALFNMQVDAGLMITASHNGKEYNGIKICLGKESVWGDQIQEIKQLFHQKACINSTKIGTYEEYNLIEDYVNWLVNHFMHLKNMDLAVAIDCGNGAAGTVLPLLIKKMAWQKIILLCEQVDGNYPNHEADPTVEKNMQDIKKTLAIGTYDLGLGLDGDCDRMAPMTNEGELVAGDKMLALFAQEIIKKNPGTSIVFDIKCSSGLSELLSKWGGVPCISASGHSIIKNQMKKRNALLAGELSCHFFFNDRYFGYDDGIYAALRLFELLHYSKKPLEKLLKIFPKKFSTAEIRLACRTEDIPGIVQKVKTYFSSYKDTDIMTIDGIRVNMHYGGGNSCWGLLRASNTQPVVCLRFESSTKDGLQRIKNEFITILEPYFGEKMLRQSIC